jgi:cystathionine beta-lyase
MTKINKERRGGIFMPNHFDEKIDRNQTNSVKWDQRDTIFGHAELLPLWVADMDFAVPPAVAEALKTRALHPIYGYTYPPPEFYQAVLAWMEKRHGWQGEKEWLLVTPGVVPALSLSILAFTKPSDRIIIQPPVYGPFFSIVKQNGRQAVLNGLKEENGRYTMDFDHLEKLADPSVKMLILCNPHNPVGRVWTPEELLRLGEFCLRHQILLVSDEIHSDLVYKNYIHTPIASLSTKLAHNTITCLAPSKTFNVAGLNTSIVVIADQEKRAQFQRTRDALGMAMYNPFGLTAFTAAYQSGGPWLDQLITYLQGNLDYLLAFCAQRIPLFKPVPPEGTFLVWLDCRQLPLLPQELNHFFSKVAKVGLNDGSAFGPGGEGYQRINIACPRPLLTQALTRIEQAVNKLAST